MIRFIFIQIIVILLLSSCENNKNQVVEEVQNNDTTYIQPLNNSTIDSIQIQSVLKDFYEWKETKGKISDFEPLDDPKSDLYKGLDLKKNEARVKELEQSNFFTVDFINDYKTIIKDVDESLKKGSIEYPKGEIQPYGNDADPWTNSQDPGDNYWSKIQVQNIKISNNIADLTWSSIGTENYKVKLKKINDKWRISYLEGFDSKYFLNID